MKGGTKIIAFVTICIIIIIVLFSISFCGCLKENGDDENKSGEISVKVVNNSNEQLEVIVIIDVDFLEEKNINPNEEYVYTDTGHKKGQEYEIKVKFTDTLTGRIYVEDITTDNDVTFTIDENYEITTATV
jgi:hypothetical protein